MCKGPVAKHDQSWTQLLCGKWIKGRPERLVESRHVREMVAGPGWWQWRWSVVEGLEK